MKVQLVEPVGNGTFGSSFHALQSTRSARPAFYSFVSRCKACTACQRPISYRTCAVLGLQMARYGKSQIMRNAQAWTAPVFAK